mgnify:CR=1 FL=1
MKYGIFSALIISVLWVILALIQLWFQPIDAEVFIKLTISAAILVAIIVVVTLVIREYLSEKQLKKDGFID